MFAGHLGVGLALGRIERRVNVGVLIGAALLLDLVLWPLVLLKAESVVIPADFAVSRQLHFVFPYSHGLVAALIWSLLAGAFGWLVWPRLQAVRRRAAAILAVAVFSHWLLDVLVHRPELPLAGAASPAVGFGLWHDMPIALALEAAIVVVGLWLFIPGSSLSPRRSIALAALSVVVLVFTVVGMTIAPAPPSVPALAMSSWITLLVVSALACWIARLVP
ncbi:MAG TPA: hypothetical protein VFK10_02475 [Burkholderiaceae bacterium]|nr:hypothetical protein [Burkholderiaceae bacterium]